jgi:hypothetical protein
MIPSCTNSFEARPCSVALGACTHTGFLPESDPAPVVEFFTRTGITAAGGQFDFERCTRKMSVHTLKLTSCRFHTDCGI